MNKAEKRLKKAQSDLESLTRDAQRIHNFTQWLQEAIVDLEDFSDYYHGPWGRDRQKVSSSHYPVAGEDAPYEAITDFERSLRELAKVAVDLAMRD